MVILFVEHHGLKVIVLAHEDEIIEKNKLTDDNGLAQNKYLRIKEKLIGRSFDISSDFDHAFDSFRKNLENPKVNKLLEKFTTLIKELFHLSGYDNLRHLKQSILDLERFYSFLPTDKLSKDELIEHILQLFFAISFELKKGEISEENILNLFLIDALAKKESDPKTPAQRIREKYSIFNRYYHPFDYQYWFQYFKFGFVKKDSLKQSIANCIYFQKDNTPDWMKLWRFYNLDDSDFNKISKRVFKKFKELKIEDKYEVVQITGILLSLSKKKMILANSDKILELGKANIDNLKAKDKLKLKKHEEFPSDASHGLVYQNHREPDFMTFLNYAKEEASKARIKDLPAEADSLLKLMKSSMNDFQEKLILTNSRNNLYYDIPILKYIPIKDFTDTFLGLSSVDKRIFGETMEKRYSHSNFNSSLKEELNWLIKLKIELENRLPQIKGKISKALINENTIVWLNKSIEKLNPLPSNVHKT